jgi:hypothetical protein
MDFSLPADLRKVMIALFFCIMLILGFSNSALAVDYSSLTWDAFTPVDGAKVTSTTVSISANASDWDSIATGSMKLYIDGSQVPAQVTLTDGEGGGG